MWLLGIDLLVDPAATEDLSADEMLLVNSFVNGRSAFTHTRDGMPSPAMGAAATRATATALRWIDEGDENAASNAARPNGSSGQARKNAKLSRVGNPADEAAWARFCASSKPILDYNECFLTDDEEEAGQNSEYNFD